MDTQQKKPYARIVLVGMNDGYTIPIKNDLDTNLQFLSDDLSSADVGDKFEIEIIELTDEEFANLKEFQGW